MTQNDTNNTNSNSTVIQIDIYKWGGQWGPFKVKIPCGECTLTGDIVKDTLLNELAGIDVEVRTQDWLSNWWKPLPAGGWHAPIVMVEGKVISQGIALNRGVLTQSVVEAYAAKTSISGNVVFGKKNCGYCTKAKAFLDDKKIDYIYHDVIENPRALYEMLARVKPIVGPKTPITTPQIWLDGQYIGGADDLIASFDKK